MILSYYACTSCSWRLANDDTWEMGFVLLVESNVLLQDKPARKFTFNVHRASQSDLPTANHLIKCPRNGESFC